jgi:hypothetical protein
LIPKIHEIACKVVASGGVVGRSVLFHLARHG